MILAALLVAYFAALILVMWRDPLNLNHPNRTEQDS